jgi:hypothetical protein
MTRQPLSQIINPKLQPQQHVSVMVRGFGEPLCKSALPINAEGFAQLLDLPLMLPRLLCQGCGVCPGALFKVEVVLALLSSEAVSSLSLAPHRAPSNLALVASLSCLCF